MPVRYKFYYFNIRARGETARWIFSQAGVEFDDVRVASKEWPEMKPTTPFRQLPILDVTDGDRTTRIAQSGAIERYLARECNLAGKNSLEMARADFLNEYLRDTMGLMPFGEEDPEKRKTLLKDAVEGAVAKNLSVLETYVGSSGFLVGDAVTWADISFATKAEDFLDFSPAALDKTPKLKKLYETVISLPNIAAFIVKRAELEKK